MMSLIDRSHHLPNVVIFLIGGCVLLTLPFWLPIYLLMEYFKKEK